MITFFNIYNYLYDRTSISKLDKPMLTSPYSIASKSNGLWSTWFSRYRLRNKEQYYSFRTKVCSQFRY